MGLLPTYSQRGGLRFDALAVATLLLLIAACALGIGCQTRWLRFTLLYEPMAV